MLTFNFREEMLNLVVPDKVCVEVGVERGFFSAEILKRNPKELFLLDPWTPQDPARYPYDLVNDANSENFDSQYENVVKKFSDDKRVKIIRGFSYFEAQKFNNESLDFVYIDAIHTFESCFCDMVTWMPKVKPDGWLCGHDFTGKEPWSYPGVKTAVEAFCRVTGYEIGLLTFEDWSSWGIRKTALTTSSMSGK